MWIWLNGERRELPAETSVAGLVELLELGDRRLAVEVNEAIVARSGFEDHVLQEGDRVEVVHAIGGG